MVRYNRGAVKVQTPAVHAVVVDSNPMFSLGVAAVLTEAGIDVDLAEDLCDWATEPGPRVAVVSTTNPGGRGLITDLRAACCDLPIVAVIGDTHTETYRAALSTGVSSAVPRDASSHEILRAVDAAWQGFSVLPITVAEELLVNTAVGEAPPCLSQTEVASLRALARGQSVTALAEELAYSDREMHRRLRRLYDRIGAANRAEAIVLATRWGIVTAADNVVVDLTNSKRILRPTDQDLQTR